MSTETLEPPPAATTTGDADTESLMAEFNKIAGPTETPETPPAQEKPPEPKPAETPKPKGAKTESEVPDEFLTDRKPEAPEVKETPEVPIEEVPANAAPKQLREALARRETRIKEQALELADYKRKLAERGDGAPNKEQEAAFKAAQERAAALEAEFERVAYERSPKFQKFNADESTEIKTAQSYLEGTEIQPSLIDAAMRVSGQARLKLLRESGMDAETIAAVTPHMARADTIRRDRDASLENWKQTMTQEQEESREQQAAEEQRRSAQEKAVWNEVTGEFYDKHPAFKPVHGNEKWTARVETNKQRAEDFALGKAPLKELFRIGLLGVAAETVEVMNAELKSRLNAATEELARLKAAQPSTGHSADVKANDKPLSDKDHYARAFEQASGQA